MPADSLIPVLDLDQPGMKSVREAVEAGHEAFYRELLAYYRSRADDIWFPPPPKDVNFHDEVADQAVAKQIHIRGEVVDTSPVYDWQAAPAGDLESTCHLAWQHFLVNLADAWWHTGREEYAEEALRALEDFVTRVAPVEYDIVNYWQIKRSGWRELEVSVRLAESWPAALSKLVRYEHLCPRLWAWIIWSVYQHAEYLLRHRCFVANHAFTNASALVTAGLVWPEFKRAQTWVEAGRKFLGEAFDEEYFADGFCKEMAMCYHGAALGCYTSLMPLLAYKQREDLLPPEMPKKLHNAVRARLKTLKPDKTVGYFNDSWASVDGLREQAEMFDDPELLYVATDGKSGTRPGFTSVFLPDSCWVTMRTGWDRDAWHLIFDAGPVGIAHQNHNALSLEVYAYGKTLLTNNGPFRYSTSPEADWHRWSRYFREQARANNTLTLHGQTQLLRDADGQMVIHPRFDYARGIFTGYTKAADVTHVRQILFVKGRYWLVRDLVRGDGGQQPEVYWHLRPGPHSFAPESGSFASNNEPGPNVAVVMASSPALHLEVVEGREEPIDGWFAPAFVDKYPAPVLIASRIGELPLSFETLIQPAAEQAPVAAVRRLTQTEATVVIEIETSAGVDLAIFQDTVADHGQIAEWAPWSTDAECLWVEGSEDGERIWASGVSRLYRDGQCVLESEDKISGVELRPIVEGYLLSLADGPGRIKSDVHLELV